MRLLLSGEGKTDIGYMVPETTGWEFKPGPMAIIVDHLLEKHSDVRCSLLKRHKEGKDCVRFVAEAEIIQHQKSKVPKFTGRKLAKGTLYFTRNAEILGSLAKSEREKSGQPVVAVLFHDADTTQSSPKNQWQQMVESIKNGFDRAGFNAGVPMVPKPKSEAWLLCGLKKSPKECEKLEEASGNDNSPNSLKSQLDKLMDNKTSAEEQAEWIKSGRINPADIAMPSFAAFRAAMETAIKNALGNAA